MIHGHRAETAGAVRENPVEANELSCVHMWPHHSEKPAEEQATAAYLSAASRRPATVSHMRRAGSVLANDSLLLLTAVIWGLAFVAQRIGMDHVGPFTYNAVRFALGALFLVPLCAGPGSLVEDRLPGDRRQPAYRRSARRPDRRRCPRVRGIPPADRARLHDRRARRASSPACTSCSFRWPGCSGGSAPAGAHGWARSSAWPGCSSSA